MLDSYGRAGKASMNSNFATAYNVIYDIGDILRQLPFRNNQRLK